MKKIIPTLLSITLFFILCLVVGCGLSNVVPGDGKPEITFESITPSKVKDYLIHGPNVVEITIGFSDSDGDLGSDSCLVVKALRPPSSLDPTGGISKYTVPDLSPRAGSKNITGKIKIRIDNLFITTLDSIQTFPYEIYITDQSGNKSNVITTTPVTITLN
ncbi:MAG: hypothetical protein NZ455_03810 [Bacteroidia bacterium]|nr:hypothetical protein [Bacteroidia bacterium]MDW8348434.1 hypothetical protein [Bacteroidia bacterium]